MSIKDMILRDKGMWLVKLPDKSKWVLDIDKMAYDDYNWYKETGTLDNSLTNIDEFIVRGEWSKLEKMNKISDSELTHLSKISNKSTNECIELAKKVKKLEALIECVYYGIVLNDEQQKLLDSIILGGDNNDSK